MSICLGCEGRYGGGGPSEESTGVSRKGDLVETDTGNHVLNN